MLFNGWGASPQVFDTVSFPEDADVWLFYDYRDFFVEMPPIQHKEVHLVAWSLGVWVATYLFCSGEKFTSTTAINGTPYSIHEHWGIPKDIFVGTLQNLNPVGYRKFNRRMCGSGETLQRYLQLETLPDSERSAELLQLFNSIMSVPLPSDKVETFWDRAIVSTSDNIMPTANMRAYWTEIKGVKVEEIDAPHMPFFTEAFQRLSWGE